MSGWVRWVTGVALLGVLSVVFLRFARAHPASDPVPQAVAEASLSTAWLNLASADEPARFVRTSPDGRTYIVVSRSFPGDHHGSDPTVPRYVIARCPPGTRPPPQPAERSGSAASRSPFDSLVGAADRVLGRGGIQPVSTSIHVLDDGRFAVVSPRDDQRPVVSLRTPEGQLLWDLSPEEIFPPPPAGIKRSRSPQPQEWRQLDWFDSTPGLLVLLGREDRLAAIEVESGLLAAGADGPALAVAALVDPQVQGREVLLEAALRQRWDGSVSAARNLLAEASTPWGLRFRAALVLAQAGDAAGHSVIVEASQMTMPERGNVEARGQLRKDVSCAWQWLAVVLGEAALPSYTKRLGILDREPCWTLQGSLAGLATLGEAGIDVVLDWVVARASDVESVRDATDPLQRFRDGESPALAFRAPRWNTAESLTCWFEMLGGNAAGLHALLHQPVAGEIVEGTSPLVPAALRYVQHSPNRGFTETVRGFLPVAEGLTGVRPEWRRLVVTEGRAALAACEAVQ